MSESNVVVAAETVKLSREEKLRAKYNMIATRIQKDTEACQELAQEINNISALAAIGVGSSIIVKIGRKFADRDTTRHVPGVVLGVQENEEGSKQYKVQYGEGFDADITVVTGAALSLPVAVEDVPAAE